MKFFRSMVLWYNIFIVLMLWFNVILVFNFVCLKLFLSMVVCDNEFETK